MPKMFKYQIGDKVSVKKVNGTMNYLQNCNGKIEDLLDVSNFDYIVRLESGSGLKFKEDELKLIKSKLNNNKQLPPYEIGEGVLYTPTEEIAVVEYIDYEHEQVEVRFSDGAHGVYDWSKVKTIEKEEDEVKGKGKFEKLAQEIGAFTDDKNKQYGSSVDATYEMIQVLMKRYEHDEENYIMPKSLLQHILLQVRMMDKQNRIFNNPSGKDEKESPYKDLSGYSLIGVDMVERIK